jgi:hypothetical protein
MNEWREKVKARWRKEMGKLGKPLGLTLDEGADAAIAELLPLMKAEMAKRARSKKCAQECVGNDQELILHNATCEGIAATIEAWEPRHDDE